MEIEVVSGDITQVAVDAILVNLFEGMDKPSGATGAVDQALGGAISQLIQEGEVKGKLGEVTLIHSLGKVPPKRVGVVGLGKKEAFNLDRARGCVADGLRALRRTGVRRAATIPFGAGAGGIEPKRAAQAVAEGAILGLYTFTQHQTKPEERQTEELLLVERQEERLPELEEGVRVGRIMAEATNLARDLTNQPANVLTPSAMAEAARKVAEASGLGFRVLERAEMEVLGMGGILGVAQGSTQPPKFIILEYKGGPPEEPPLGLVGKAITFDSGGISIKPAEGMGEMKEDMAGGAAVIAAMGAIAQLKPAINVTALIPTTENLPSGSAMKPGDVIRILGQKTVEVISTDAEGRLILADALAYANKLGLKPLVDLATLTGACHVALGDLYSGAFSNNPELLEKVVQAGKEAGERHWPMPTDEEYKEQNKSDMADIKNTGGRWGGAITAALFLQEFAGETPWAHLDIAGPSRAERDRGYQVKGATGVGVRTVVNLALALAEGR
jgi:leucyl aminopeptidase